MDKSVQTEAETGSLPSVAVSVAVMSAGQMRPGMRVLPEETPVALTYNGSSYAVMMATPDDLEDFAVGFALTEQVIGSVDDVLDIERLSPDGSGLEVRLWLAEPCADRLAARRRRLAGPVGCGLCGIESIREAVRAPVAVTSPAFQVSADDIGGAMADLERAQRLHHATHAVHAAALWRRDAGLLAIREDVGRHNALDKLVGAAAREEIDPAGAIALVTSRVSVDLIQKAARLNAAILVAASAPTGLAVRAAQECGLTLVGLTRGARIEIFTHPERVAGSPIVATRVELTDNLAQGRD